MEGGKKWKRTYLTWSWDKCLMAMSVSCFVPENEGKRVPFLRYRSRHFQLTVYLLPFERRFLLQEKSSFFVHKQENDARGMRRVRRTQKWPLGSDIGESDVNMWRVYLLSRLFHRQWRLLRRPRETDRSPSIFSDFWIEERRCLAVTSGENRAKPNLLVSRIAQEDPTARWDTKCCVFEDGLVILWSQILWTFLLFIVSS